MNNQGDKQWRVNREINLGEIVSLLTMIGFIVGIYVVQTNQITKLESSDSAQWKVISDNKSSLITLQQSVKEDYNRLDDKLDDIRNLIIQQQAGRNNGN